MPIPGPSHKVAGDWRTASMDFKAHLRHLYNTGLFSDTKFFVVQVSEDPEAEGKVIFEAPAHNFVVNLWKVGEAGGGEELVDFFIYNASVESAEEDVRDMEVFIKYLYTEEVDQIKDFWGVLHMAVRFLLKDVAENCRVHLRRTFTEQNAVIMLEQANRVGDMILLQECLPFVVRNAKRVLRSQEFLEIKQPFLAFLLQLQDFEVDELELFQALVRWAGHACEQRNAKKASRTMRRMLKGAEKLIRLSLMTLRDIREVVIPTKIYETDYITGCIFRNDWDSGPNSCVARVCSIEEGIIGDTQTVAKMMTKLERMLTENLMTDAIFRDGETEFRLHTFVLKLWSAKFQDIEHGRQVHFNDPGALNTHLLLVKDMYELETPRDLDTWLSCLALAFRYEIPFLKEKYATHLQSFICDDTALTFYIWGRNTNSEGLMAAAKPHVLKNAETIFEDPAFLDVSEDNLCSLLVENDLQIKELDLFNHIVRWADERLRSRGRQVNENTRSQQLVRIKRYIRFPLMTYEEFTNVVLPKSILNEEEKEEVMLHFLGEEFHVPKFNYTKRNLTLAHPISTQEEIVQGGVGAEDTISVPMWDVEQHVAEAEAQNDDQNNRCSNCGILFTTANCRKMVESCGHLSCLRCVLSKREGCALCLSRNIWVSSNDQDREEDKQMPPPPPPRRTTRQTRSSGESTSTSVSPPATRAARKRKNTDHDRKKRGGKKK